MRHLARAGRRFATLNVSRLARVTRQLSARSLKTYRWVIILIGRPLIDLITLLLKLARPSRDLIRRCLPVFLDSVPLIIATLLLGSSAIPLYWIFHVGSEVINTEPIGFDFDCQFNPSVRAQLTPNSQNNLRGKIGVSLPSAVTQCSRLIVTGVNNPTPTYSFYVHMENGCDRYLREGHIASNVAWVHNSDGNTVGLDLNSVHEKYGECISSVELSSEDFHLIHRRNYTRSVLVYNIGIISRFHSAVLHSSPEKLSTTLTLPVQFQVTSKSVDAVTMSLNPDSSSRFYFDGPIVMFLDNEELARMKEVELFFYGAIFATGIAVLAEYLTKIAERLKKLLA